MDGVVAAPDTLQELSNLLGRQYAYNATELHDCNAEISSVSLNATKLMFDRAVSWEKRSDSHIMSLLGDLFRSPAVQTRSQEAKRNQLPLLPPPKQIPLTPLASLHINKMAAEQIWAQLELRNKNTVETLAYILDGGPEEPMNIDGDNAKNDDEGDEDEEEFEEEELALNGFDLDLDEDDSDSNEEEFLEEEGLSEDDDDEPSIPPDVSALGEEVATLQDEFSDDDEEEFSVNLDRAIRPDKLNGLHSPMARGAASELDDGFFDLSAFNRETEEAEARNVSRGSLADTDDDEDEDEEVDLFQLVEDPSAFDEEDEGVGEEYYKDFFDPPSGKAGSSQLPKTKQLKLRLSKEEPPRQSKVRFHDEVRVKNIQSVGKGRPIMSLAPLAVLRKAGLLRADNLLAGGEDAEMDGLEDEDDFPEDGLLEKEVDIDEAGDDEVWQEEDGLEADDNPFETNQRLQDDLFAADDEAEQPDISTHEKRVASLREQIKALEQENVGPKDWTLIGEVNSRARPQHSLLEEDLQFDRVTRPTPVVTEEVIENLETRIKQRIIEARYDDVVRRRPVDNKPFLPSRMFQLNDAKSAQSLAEIYEDEYSRAVSAQGGTPVIDDRDGRLAKEHEEIERSWERICNTLDALCNAHFTPKQPKATISTLQNVASASLESTLPTMNSTATMLAPEEVFAASSSDLRTRSELTSAEKRTARSKARKERKKQRDALEKSVDKFARSQKPKGSIKQQKDAALKSVIKTGKGVTVVGKDKKFAKSAGDTGKKRTS